MTGLRELVAAELAGPADPRAVAMGEAIAAGYGDAARAILFYGSCLRAGGIGEGMLDFYLIVSDYDAAFGKGWLARANRLLPPNVFPFRHGELSAKYAVLSESDFDRLCGAETLSVSVWARFAQPARLVWAADEAARCAAVSAVARAAPTLLAAAHPMFAGDEPLALWREAFRLTYGAELRAERGGRAASVVDADPERYALFAAPAAVAAGIGRVKDGHLVLTPAEPAARAAAARDWRRRRRAGKALSLLRLAKASGTYRDGIDYLAWKINRHAGTDIRLADWQRRFPILGALILLPRLWRRGVVR